MTGPEHYAEAERLLQTAREYRRQNGGPLAAAVAAEAKAHATLAVAAVTWDAACLARTNGGALLPLLADTADAWDRVTT